MTELLPVPSLDELRRRGSAKWRMQAPGILPLSIAEMDFDIAEPIRETLRARIDAGDLGYADGFTTLAEAYAGFARRSWGWEPDLAGIQPYLVDAEIRVGSKVLYQTPSLLR